MFKSFCFRIKKRIQQIKIDQGKAGESFKTTLDLEVQKFAAESYCMIFAERFGFQSLAMRYFNVYGPREEHKGSMASTVLHFYNQILETGKAKLFSGNDGYADGEQKRDFIYVKDVAEINLWFLENNISGIFNTGTGKSASFKDLRM